MKGSVNRYINKNEERSNLLAENRYPQMFAVRRTAIAIGMEAGTSDKLTRFILHFAVQRVFFLVARFHIQGRAGVYCQK